MSIGRMDFVISCSRSLQYTRVSEGVIKRVDGAETVLALGRYSLCCTLNWMLGDRLVVVDGICGFLVCPYDTSLLCGQEVSVHPNESYLFFSILIAIMLS